MVDSLTKFNKGLDTCLEIIMGGDGDLFFDIWSQEEIFPLYGAISVRLIGAFVLFWTNTVGL